MRRWLIFCISVLLFTCTDRTFENPYDSKVSKESWAPQDFQLEITGNNSVRLTWAQPEERVDGFLLIKKINGKYEEFNLDPADRSYEDDVANPEIQKRLKIEYFLKAKASTSFSDQVKIDSEVELPFLPPSIELIDVTPYSRTAFAASAQVNSDGGKDVTSFGICWNMTGNPSVNDNKINSSGDYRSYITQIPDLIYLNQYYIRAFAINEVGVSYSNEIVRKLQNPFLNPNLNYQKVSDINGNGYATILIGAQTWMAENLEVVNFNNNEAIPNVLNGWGDLIDGAYCDYQNDPANSLWFGRLYNHFAAVDSRGLCPSGWHLPSGVEFDDLFTYNSSNGSLSSELGWTNPYSNSTGFSAVPAGINVKGNYEARGTQSYYWTSDLVGTAWIIENINGKQGGPRILGQSIRCLKN